MPSWHLIFSGLPSWECVLPKNQSRFYVYPYGLNFVASGHMGMRANQLIR
ncbi:hypothetical protein D515_02842 [Grimontia indica]|uniref:Uncharacterized protein n=1 Tax=Grimontia indica TaxID=1056512 RepID=R1GQJ6_9GAMM|nr:hypothetical protein D515_02842 [Grimontia indica]